MNRFASLAAGGSIALASLIGSAGAETITYGSYLAARHATNVTSVEPWMRAVEKATGGSLTFELMGDGTLVGGRDSLQGIREGLIDMSTIVDFYTPNELKSSTILTELAMLGTDAASMTGAINEMQLLNCRTCISEAEDNNLKILAIYASAPYHFICNKPFSKVEDFKGARIRATGAWAIFATALGATPVNVTSGEMYEALQRGQVDCTLINVPALTNYSLFEVAKYVIDLPIGTFHGAHVYNMNTEVWAERTDTERKAMIDNIAVAMANLTEGAIKEDAHAREVSTKAGVVFAPADQSLIDALATFKKDELTRITELAKSRGIEDPEAMFDKFQELIAKWEGIAAATGSDWKKYAEAMQLHIYDKVK